MSFAKPASATGINWADLNGALLLIEPSGIEVGVKTIHGESDAVKATVTILDGPQAGTENIDTLIFPKVLISQVRGQIGAMVLGRLGQGQAKTGQTAPWRLAEATDADVVIGEKWLAHRGQSKFSNPVAAQAAVPAQAAAPAAAPAAAVAPTPAWAR